MPGPTLFDYYTVNNYTALDSPESVAWLLSLQTPNGDRLVDDEGNFDGECERYLESCDEGACDDHDADADGVVDLCDACPFLPNAQDTDGDDIPDCTDPCPSHPRESDAPACDQGGDFDCDGVCDGFDNCPYTPNLGQENANADAEAAWIDDSTLAPQEMGDACEPVPVPASEPLAVERIASQGVSSSLFTDVVSLNVQDGIRVRPLRSRRTKLSKSGTTSYQPVGVPTHFRYCQYLASGEPGLQCDDPALISSDEVHYELASANDETAAMRWHRVTMSNMTTSKKLTRGAPWVTKYDDSDYSWRWLYQTDASFWALTNIVSVPPAESTLLLSGGPASGLDGRFWVHAQTFIGTFGNTVGTGAHGGPALAGTEELASSYFDLDPEFISESRVSKPLASREPIFLWRTLADPPVDFRVSAVEDAVRGGAEWVVATEGGDVGLLNLDGSAQVLGPQLDAPLRANLQDVSLVWASASEPSPLIGRGAPIAVGIRADGVSIGEQVTVSADGASLTGARPTPTTAVATLTTPTRSGFVPVYSSAIQLVFLVGGVDMQGHWNGDVLRMNLGGNAARFVSTVKFRDVLAAAYSFRARSLYLIDHGHIECDDALDSVACEATRGDCNAVVRLIRVDAFGRDAEVVAAWTGAEFPERVWLTSDLQGNMLVSLSNAHPKRHALLRFDVEAETLTRLEEGAHELAAPAFTDSRGFVVYTQRGNGRIKGRRYPTLSGAAHPMSSLGSLVSSLVWGHP
ncbi:MAG: thrombospondin type 3 repeat-containing protein [Polyangiaceae bacterium]